MVIVEPYTTCNWRHIDDAAVNDTGTILEENYTGTFNFNSFVYNSGDTTISLLLQIHYTDSMPRAATVKYLVRKWLG